MKIDIEAQRLFDCGYVIVQKIDKYGELTRDEELEFSKEIAIKIIDEVIKANCMEMWKYPEGYTATTQTVIGGYEQWEGFKEQIKNIQHPMAT